MGTTACATSTPPRERLLRGALALFAQHGYAQASTRDIAEAAGTNVAAISYYFGDKAGLYRAVFLEPMGDPADEIARFADPTLSLDEALRGFFTGFVEPLRHGDLMRQCMKLHMREMVEPSGLWAHEIEHVIRPQHDALVALLVRALGLRRADDELLRLAVAIAGLGVHLHVSRDVVDALAPRLHQGPAAIDRWLDALVMYAAAMVEAERRRRAARAEARR
jgi:TetR/AcrR family transcriptional regulator, regulator of cefoperazone and chloramphenicol sensitivity